MWEGKRILHFNMDDDVHDEQQDDDDDDDDGDGDDHGDVHDVDNSEDDDHEEEEEENDDDDDDDHHHDAYDFRTQYFARACAIETHMDISQEPFCRNLERKCRTRMKTP